MTFGKPACFTYFSAVGDGQDIVAGVRQQIEDGIANVVGANKNELSSHVTMALLTWRQRSLIYNVHAAYSILTQRRRCSFSYD